MSSIVEINHLDPDSVWFMVFYNWTVGRVFALAHFLAMVRFDQ